MIQGLYKLFDHWHAEGSLYICSDPHFDDRDLENGIKGRPSSDEIVRRINSKCGKTDTLIILGDIGNIEYVKKLRAKRKILIKGNHDAGKSNYERIIQKSVFSKDEYGKEEALIAVKELFPNYRYVISEGHMFHPLGEHWIVEADNMLFDEVYEGPLMLAEKLILSHEPLNIDWAFNMHGHVHQKGKEDANHLNCCLDVNNYEPINMNQFMKKSGALSKINTVHRSTIDKATKRKAKRGGKKIGGK